MKNFLWTLWQLPQTILGVLYFLILSGIDCIQDTYVVSDIKNRKARVYVSRIGNKSAFSLGNYIFINNGYQYQVEEVCQHEFGHTIQSYKLGWLYLLVIGLPSLFFTSFMSSQWMEKFYTEKWANKLTEDLIMDTKIIN